MYEVTITYIDYDLTDNAMTVICRTEEALNTVFDMYPNKITKVVKTNTVEVNTTMEQ
jgi:hypothetical protein